MHSPSIESLKDKDFEDLKHHNNTSSAINNYSDQHKSDNISTLPSLSKKAWIQPPPLPDQQIQIVKFQKLQFSQIKIAASRTQNTQFEQPVPRTGLSRTAAAAAPAVDVAAKHSWRAAARSAPSSREWRQKTRILAGTPATLNREASHSPRLIFPGSEKGGGRGGEKKKEGAEGGTTKISSFTSTNYQAGPSAIEY